MGNTHSASYSNFKPRKNVHWKTAERPSAPGRPEIIPILSEEEPNAVTLKWTPPRHHGGAPLQGYQVECNRIGSPAWIRTSPPVVTKPELILTGLEPDFKYQFRVAAINAVGNSDYSELSDILNISMDKVPLAVPRFLETLEDVTCLENDKTEFRVYFEGIPTPTISWFKDGFEVFSSRRTAITTDNNSSVLVFHQTLLNDEGEIKCTATNRVGHAVAKGRLILEASPKLRYPRQYEDGLLYEINETIFLKTSVVGKPPPSLEWRHDGQSIYTGDRIEITNSDKLSMLRIHNAQRSDRGEYQVKATNSVGEDVASFLVTITAPPDPPGGIVVTRQIDKSVTLSWKPPLDDGGCKIGNYIVEYYRTGWNVWLKAITSRKFSATLFDLIEGSEYRFRVKAESPYGMSEPSQESNPVFIPGKSVDMKFLEVESRIINDALVKEDGEEELPQISPRKKRNASLRRDDEDTQISEKSSSRGQSPSHTDSRVEQVIWRRSLTEKRLSPNKKEKSPSGSNEFMLILCPNGEKRSTGTEKRRSFQLDLEDALSPPPISFSAPDLGSPFVPMRPIRNAVSSTELLHERAMDRFYRAVAMKEDMKSQDDHSYNVAKPEIQVEMHEDPYEHAETDEENDENIAEELSAAMKTFAGSKRNTNYLSSQHSPTYSNRWQSGSFDDDYTASTVSTGSDVSENTSLSGEVGRMDYSNEENQTYHPREMNLNSNVFDNQKQDQAVEVLTKPAPLPDPNFVPKPILKRRNSNNVAEQTQVARVKHKKSPEKSNLLGKLTKIPLQKSFPFPKIISKKQSSKTPDENDKERIDNNLKEIEVKANEMNKESLEEGRIAIEYYGNIVKEYGSQKKPSNQYMNTEQLKQAAEKQQVNTRQTQSTVQNENPVTNDPNNINSFKSNLSVPAVKRNNLPRSLVKNEKPKSAAETTLPFKTITENASKKPSRAVIVIPIDYEELENQAKINVRSAIDYTIDICLLLLAFWLFLFKDERLAIPVLVLITYRQLQDVIMRNIPNWMKRWKVKKT